MRLAALPIRTKLIGSVVGSGFLLVVGTQVFERCKVINIERVADTMEPLSIQSSPNLSITFEEVWTHDVDISWRSEDRAWAIMGHGEWGKTADVFAYLSHNGNKLVVLDRQTGAVVYDQPLEKELVTATSNQPLCIEGNRVWVLGSKDWYLDLATGEWAQEEYTGTHEYRHSLGERVQRGAGCVWYRDEDGKTKWRSRKLRGTMGARAWIGDTNVYATRYLYKSTGPGWHTMKGTYLHALSKVLSPTLRDPHILG